MSWCFDPDTTPRPYAKLDVMNEQDRPDRDYPLPTPDLGAFGEPEGARPPQPDDGPTDSASGTIRYQDASTERRPPTLAEQRARMQAEEELAARQAVADQRATTRRRVMIGAGVTVGVAALVAGWYTLASPASVTARCAVAGTGGDANTVVADQNCDPAYATAHNGYVSNGFVFIPLVGGGFRQYHYYYGGTGTIGQRVSGGSFTAPSHATVRTGSGTTIQRGGFGITGKTGGIGGSSGGTGGKTGGS
jgi:hypothetical protein